MIYDLELHWSLHAEWPMLLLLQSLPMAIAAMLWFVRYRSVAIILALAGAIMVALLSLLLYQAFDVHLPAYQFAEFWHPWAMFSYHVGVDGTAVLFLLSSAWLHILLVLYGILRADPDPARSLAILFACQGAQMAMLASLDLLQFWIASVLHLGLVNSLLRQWTGISHCGRVSSRFLAFMATGLVLLLLGTLLLGWNHAQHSGWWSFDLFDLTEVGIGGVLESVIFFLLFYGLIIRLPAFPLHGWLPTMLRHGAITVGILMLGTKTGIFALSRFLLPLLPDAVDQWYPAVIGFAIAGTGYAVVLALLQRDLRRLLAYAAIGHGSILIIGLFVPEAGHYSDSILMTVNLGLAISVLLLVAGLIQRRAASPEFVRMGGLFFRLPFLGTVFCIAALTANGLPGIPSLSAVDALLSSNPGSHGGNISRALAGAEFLASGLLLWAFFKAFLFRRAYPLPTPVIRRAPAVEPFAATAALLILLANGLLSDHWSLLLEHSAYRPGVSYHP